MTNEEREALIAQGWTPPPPPPPVDPDIDMAHAYAKQLLDVPHPLNIDRAYDYFLGAIKQARGLERAQFKPKMVWVKHDGGESPVDRHTQVAVIYDDNTLIAGDAHERDWSIVVLYVVITPPAEEK